MAIFLFFSFVLLLPPFFFFSLLYAVKGEWRAKNKHLQTVQARSYFSVILELNKSRSLKTSLNSSFTGIPGLQRRHLVAIHPGLLLSQNPDLVLDLNRDWRHVQVYPYLWICT